MLKSLVGQRVTALDVAAFTLVIWLAVASPYTPVVHLPVGQLACLAVIALYMIRRRERR
jgi:hypothetical protein